LPPIAAGDANNRARAIAGYHSAMSKLLFDLRNAHANA
jgi:hypothetical protein